MNKSVQIGLFDLLEDPDLEKAARGAGHGGRRVELFARKRSRKTWREFDPMNFEEIARVLGISRQGARKIFIKAMHKLKRIVESNPRKYDRLRAYLAELEKSHPAAD